MPPCLQPQEQIDIRRFDVFTELIDDVRQELLATG